MAHTLCGLILPFSVYPFLECACIRPQTSGAVDQKNGELEQYSNAATFVFEPSTHVEIGDV